jgi:dihydroxy-acid dehydratase
MACIAEALGMTLPGAACTPAVYSQHSRLASATGRRAVDIAWEKLTPNQIISQAAIDNAIVTQLTIGGSTNAIVHIIALAGRAGVNLSLARFDELSAQVPVLGNIRPGGQYLMEDFYQAGGLAALLNELQDLLNLDCPVIGGGTLGSQIKGAEIINNDVVRKRDNAVSATGGTCILRGNLAPDGCVIKTIAADPRLLQHRGRAIVFDCYADMKKMIDDPDLPVTADSVIVLRSAGPLGAPGFPEWGMLPIPKKLLQAGVRDMVRISDARMSGTSYGTCVLHVSPESHLGGPLALVQTGDEIELDVAHRSIHWCVSEDEIARRRAAWNPPAVHWTRGYQALFAKHVTQAHLGCDFDFLTGNSPNRDPDIF